jgi:hypothetical protein
VTSLRTGLEFAQRMTVEPLRNISSAKGSTPAQQTKRSYLVLSKFGLCAITFEAFPSRCGVCFLHFVLEQSSVLWINSYRTEGTVRPTAGDIRHPTLGDLINQISRKI